MHNAWRPTAFEEADLPGGVRVYRFDVTDSDGLKHTGLPPGFADERTGGGE